MQDVLWCSLPVRSLERLNSFEIQGASDQGPVNMAQGEHTGGWRVRKRWIRDDSRLLICQLDPSGQYFWPIHIDGFSHVVACWHVQNDAQQVWICNLLQWLAGWKVTRTSYTSPGDVCNSSSWYLMVLTSQHIGLSRPCCLRCQRASAWGGNWGRDGHREKATKPRHD